VTHAALVARYILPNIFPPILVQATRTIATAIIAEASLSFLGLGQQPPAPSWGSMLNVAKNFLEQAPWMALWPGIAIFLVVLGQFSFITTITSLVITARLKKFDEAMEEAALNLGASRSRVLRTVTLPYLRPAMIASAIVAILVSFENFNTTLMLTGADAPLSITMYDRVAKAGSTPVLNAVSVFLMVVSGLLAFLSVAAQSRRQ